MAYARRHYMPETVNRTLPTERDDYSKLNAVRTRDPHGMVGDDDVVDAADADDDDHDSNGTCSLLLPLRRFHVRSARPPHPTLGPDGPWGGRG